MMRNQFDYKKRVVSLANLIAMCARVSGTCHTFQVVRVMTNRVYVEYSNPNEYGTADPITAVYPCYAAPDKTDADNRSVVIDALRYLRCTGKNEESWQAFWQLEECQELYRVSSDSEDWETLYEVLVKKHPQYKVRDEWRDKGSKQVWICLETEFPSWREAQDWAAEKMTELQRKQSKV